MLFAAVHSDAIGRYCCKSLFALLIKNSPGCRRDFRVKMWGTSSPDDKLTGDLGNVIEATQIGGRRSDRLMAGKLSPGNFGLLQQYRPLCGLKSDISRGLRSASFQTSRCDKAERSFDLHFFGQRLAFFGKHTRGFCVKPRLFVRSALRCRNALCLMSSTA
jgi:hypothetical protein